MGPKDEGKREGWGGKEEKVVRNLRRREENGCCSN